MNNKDRVRRLTFLALFTAFAILLSYVEFILPPIYSAVPGIKLGLPNVAIILALYRYGVRDAAAVSLVRLVLVAMLFGNPVTFIYSFAGAALSLALMAILKKLDFLSETGVSVAGAVSHNLGQIAVAMILLRTAELGYYMIVLAVTGTVAGIFVGLVGRLLIKRLEKI